MTLFQIAYPWIVLAIGGVTAVAAIGVSLFLSLVMVADWDVTNGLLQRVFIAAVISTLGNLAAIGCLAFTKWMLMLT